MFKKNIGKKGEDIVCNYLYSIGYTILACNYYLQWGEIDIIASHNNIIHFIEVKTRSMEDVHRAEYLFNYNKQIKLWRSVSFYVAKFSITQWQIDLVVVYLQNRKIIWYPNISLEIDID